MAKLDKRILEWEDSMRWFESYIKQVEGYAAMAENFAEGLSDEWMAMSCGLRTLAGLMREDIKHRKELANA